MAPGFAALLRVIEFVRPVSVPELEGELAADAEGADHLAARADADRAALLEAGADWAGPDGGPLPFERGYEPKAGAR